MRASGEGHAGAGHRPPRAWTVAAAGQPHRRTVPEVSEHHQVPAEEIPLRQTQITQRIARPHISPGEDQGEPCPRRAREEVGERVEVDRRA